MTTKRKPAIKIRKSWGILNPVTRVKPSAKLYQRKKFIGYPDETPGR